MSLCRVFFVFLIAIGFAHSTLWEVRAQHQSPGVIRCRNCGQTISPRVPHQCPKKDPAVEFVKALSNALEEANKQQQRMITCRNCGARYPQGQMHRCQPLPQQPRLITCRNCGARYYEGQNHRCRPQVEGNAVPSKKPSVEKANPTTLKLASFNQQNISAIQESVVSPLKDTQMSILRKDVPSAQEIAKKIDTMNFTPQLSVQDRSDLLQAIGAGDEGKVKGILDRYATTGQDNSTLLGLAGVQKLVNGSPDGQNIKPSDIKNLVNTLQNGDPSLLGKLTSSMLILGTINKIGKILDIASTILNGGGSLTGTNIPTGIVPIVTFPGLPYGVVFPLGNGVYGIGTGGVGNTGIYQGYLPKPTIYSGGNIGTSAWGKGVDIVLHNDNDESIRYYFPGDRDVKTIKGHSWITWNLSNRQSIGVPSGQGNKWTVYDIEDGAYAIVKKSEGGYELQEQNTSITLKSPGNPIPFTFYTGENKFVIEPGKSITLTKTDEGNGLMEIRFARSSNTNDVATHLVGGELTFYVGQDKSAAGKWALFSEEEKQVKPSTPQKKATSSSASLTYDDTVINTSNAGGLPVLPSYE